MTNELGCIHMKHGGQVDIINYFYRLGFTWSARN